LLSSIAAPIFVIGVLVLFHELGHFLVAKWSGIRVETFSIGFGPAIAAVRRGGTVYKISWIPFGGYVKMSGEDPDEEEQGDEPWRFQNKSVPVRAAVILAGPAANGVLAVLTYSLIFFAYGIDVIGTTTIGQVTAHSPAGEAGMAPGDSILTLGGAPVTNWNEVVGELLDHEGSEISLTVLRQGEVKELSLRFDLSEPIGMAPRMEAMVGEALSGGPAAEAGLQRGDRIVSINDIAVGSWADLVEQVQSNPGVELHIRFERSGEILETSVVPQAAEETRPDGEKRTVGRLQIAQYQEKQRVGIFSAIREGVLQTGWVVRNVFDFLKLIFSGRATRDMVGGPVAIISLAGESARQGLDTLLYLLALLSVELGILNLLPIPVLDGGHMVFLGIEALRRRPLSLQQRALLQQIGLLVILLLMATVTVVDVGRLFD